jgi:hypothetical protein
VAEGYAAMLSPGTYRLQSLIAPAA